MKKEGTYFFDMFLSRSTSPLPPPQQTNYFMQRRVLEKGERTS